MRATRPRTAARSTCMHASTVDQLLLLGTEAAEPELERRIPAGGDVEEGQLPALLAGGGAASDVRPDLLRRLEVAVRLEGEEL